jgi:pectin methylesterase-like acyl-CoA thioesterase
VNLSGNDVSNVGTLSATAVDTDGLLLADSSLLDNKALADDGNVYDTIQGAVDAASSWVRVGPGTFSESVSISSANLTLVGSGRDTLVSETDSTSDNAILSDSDGVVVKNIAVETTTGSNKDCIRLTSNECEVMSVWVEQSTRHGVAIGGQGCRVVSVWANSGSITNDDVLLFGNNSLADDIIGTVGNTGTDNTVGETV